MTVGKIYRYLELWPAGYNLAFKFKENRLDELEYILIEDFAEDGKITQNKILEMLYPGYPWDVIIKLYNEAPRSQK